MNIFGDDSENTFPSGISTTNVSAIDASADVELGANEIDLIATTVSINGVPIAGGGVQNPMVATLNGGGQDINNVNSLTVSTIDSDAMIMGATNIELLSATQITGLLTLNGGLDVASISQFNGNNISDVNTITTVTTNCQSFLEVSSPAPTIVNSNASAGFTIDPTGFFNIKKVSGLTVVPMLSITDATKINMTVALDMNNNPINNVSLINNITPAGGLYMTTSDANIITATTTQTSLFAGASFTPVSGLTVPANAFTVSSYRFNMAGNVSTNNGDTLTLSLYNGGVLASLVIALTGSSGEFFELEADFSIRTLGGVGVASISTNFDFTYSDSGATAWRGKRTCVVNNTTFSTTINNTLDIRAQWSSTSANNSIQCLQAILSRTF